MAGVKELMSGVLQFLAEQQTSSCLDEDAKESLEVAAQCLETAYSVSKDTYPLPDSLVTVFQYGLQHCPVKTQSQTVPQDSEEAERLKSLGNDMMKADKYSEAIDFYSQAILNDPTKSVYYCNRAAAYSKMNQQEESINDCVQALQIDPMYSKAYGRKGLAHSARGEHALASDCFKKALELDPANDSYKNNLALADQKAKEETGQPGGDAGSEMGGLNLGGLNLGAMLNNPALLNMASSMMANPQMQSMMANLMSGASNQQGGPQGIGNLLQAGQQLAQEMQSSNPELVEQLRQQVQQPPNPDEPDSSGTS